MSPFRKNSLLTAVMLIGLAVYVTAGLVLGSWFWLAGLGILLAFLGWAADSLVRGRRKKRSAT